jgi:phenylalanyl-tRNA synthetase beta chain
MKISPAWLREFVDLNVDEPQLARDLTMHGIAVEGISGEGKETVYEVEFTANRPDAMNHYGVARECSAIYDVDLKEIKVPTFGSAKDGAPSGSSETPTFPIVIEDASGCARYTARLIRGVKIGASSEGVMKRLESVEQRSINNAADASNYVLWEMGHPTHAFDLDKLEGGKIIVRRAKEGEVLRTLDGVERKLSREDLVIADAVKPVALAGVMGGFDSMITEFTTNVLIESAWFDPGSVRKTAKRHGLHTDASHRFERGADYAATPLACDRVSQLILESAGGQLEGGIIDAVARKVSIAPVTLHQSEVKRILGEDIPDVGIERILRRLGFGLIPGRAAATSASLGAAAATGGTGGTHAAIAEEVADWTVRIPTWRLDVEREVDVIEEIARVWGYDKFPNTLPEFAGAVEDLPDAAKDAKVRSTLLALGYDEAMSLTFIPKADAQAFTGAAPVEIANPLSEEAAFMRPSLVPGMLDMLAYNLNRDTSEVRLFEAGNIYERVGERTEEHKRVCLGATFVALTAEVPQGATLDKTSSDNARALEAFRAFKGDIEDVLSRFEYRSLYYDEHSAEFFHPGRSARAVMDGTTVARFGQIHPDVSAARKLKQDVYVAEIYLDRLYERDLREPKYVRIPRYPAVDRDFSFIFPNEVTFERIRTQVEALHLPELREFAPVEIFRGGAVPAGKYSVLLRAEFQSAERTLTDDEVAGWASQIVKALGAIGGKQRA